jgi:hypothetical protein
VIRSAMLSCATDIGASWFLVSAGPSRIVTD